MGGRQRPQERPQRRAGVVALPLGAAAGHGGDRPHGPGPVGAGPVEAHQQDDGRQQRAGRGDPVAGLAVAVVRDERLGHAVGRLLGLVRHAGRVEVEHLLQRVEPLAARRPGGVEQQHLVAPARELVAGELQKLALDVGDHYGVGLGAPRGAPVGEQVDRGDQHVAGLAGAGRAVDEAEAAGLVEVAPAPPAAGVAVDQAAPRGVVPPVPGARAGTPSAPRATMLS